MAQWEFVQEQPGKRKRTSAVERSNSPPLKRQAGSHVSYFRVDSPRTPNPPKRSVVDLFFSMLCSNLASVLQLRSLQTSISIHGDANHPMTGFWSNTELESLLQCINEHVSLIGHQIITRHPSTVGSEYCSVLVRLVSTLNGQMMDLVIPVMLFFEVGPQGYLVTHMDAWPDVYQMVELFQTSPAPSLPLESLLESPTTEEDEDEFPAVVPTSSISWDTLLSDCSPPFLPYGSDPSLFLHLY